MTHPSPALAPEDDTDFVRFWNEVLAPKFIRFRHILVDGLAQHSAAVFPELPVRPGDRVMDVGCGFGDTAVELARRAGPQGRVTGVDCCDAFLDEARAAARDSGLANIDFLRADAERILARHEQADPVAREAPEPPAVVFLDQLGARLEQLVDGGYLQCHEDGDDETDEIEDEDTLTIAAE